jgi:hypothetical protein
LKTSPTPQETLQHPGFWRGMFSLEGDVRLPNFLLKNSNQYRFSTSGKIAHKRRCPLQEEIALSQLSR